jgi:hypothetical protein
MLASPSRSRGTTVPYKISVQCDSNLDRARAAEVTRNGSNVRRTSV